MNPTAVPPTNATLANAKVSTASSPQATQDGDALTGNNKPGPDTAVQQQRVLQQKMATALTTSAAPGKNTGLAQDTTASNVSTTRPFSPTPTKAATTALAPELTAPLNGLRTQLQAGTTLAQSLAKTGTAATAIVQRTQLLPELTSTAASLSTRPTSPGAPLTPTEPALGKLAPSLPVLVFTDQKNDTNKGIQVHLSAASTADLSDQKKPASSTNKQWLVTAQIVLPDGKKQEIAAITQQMLPVGVKLNLTATDKTGHQINAKAISHDGHFVASNSNKGANDGIKIIALKPERPWIAQVISSQPLAQTATATTSVSDSSRSSAFNYKTTAPIGNILARPTLRLELAPSGKAPSATPNIQHNTSKAPVQQWHIQLSITDNEGRTFEQKAVSSQAITPNTVISLTNAPQRPVAQQPNTSAIEPLLPLIKTGIQLAAMEGRPIADIVQLAKVVIQANNHQQIFQPGELKLLQAISKFGINPNSDLKTIIGQTGLFQASINTASANPQPADNMGVAKDVLTGAKQLADRIATSSVVKNSSTTDEADDNVSLKQQLAALIALLSVNSQTSSGAPKTATPSKDPLLALMSFFAKQLTVTDKPATAKNETDAVKERMSLILKQVLLGMQGTGLKSLLEHHSTSEPETNNATLLNVELPIHWSSGVAKASLIVQQRYGRTGSDEKDENTEIKSWQFELSMDFPGDRILTTRCNLDEKRVRIQFWANKEDFKQLIEKSMTGLKKRMEDDDIVLDYCGCALGIAPDNGGNTARQRLINTRV